MNRTYVALDLETTGLDPERDTILEVGAVRFRTYFDDGRVRLAFAHLLNRERLFEKLCLESFQSGLSWRTILAKRDNFRRAFRQFDFNKVARFTDKDVERLLQDEGIVRHRGKIEAVINNAKRAK